MNNVLNILITDVGHPVTASAIETLRNVTDLKYNIVGIDHSIAQYPVGELWTDYHYVVPSPANANEYINAVLGICSKHDISVIVPWTNEEVIVFAEYASTFLEHGIKILASSIDSINKVVDKHCLMNNLKQAGFETPSFYSVDTISELRSAVEALGYPTKKVVVKPRNLSGARGFCLLDSRSTISRRDFSDSLPFPAYVEVIKHLPAHQQTSLDLIVMDYLYGEDYSVDILANGSKPVAIIPRIRLQSDGGVSSMGETVYNAEVSRIAAKVVEDFGLDLNINVQMRYKEGREGSPFVYDVNPRISGTIAANDHMGINFIHEGILMLLTKTSSLPPNPVYRHALMVRRWKEEYIDFEDSFLATAGEGMKEKT